MCMIIAIYYDSMIDKSINPILGTILDHMMRTNKDNEEVYKS